MVCHCKYRFLKGTKGLIFKNNFANNLFVNSSIFCITDAAQNTVAVTVYNLVEGKGVIIGDAVAIPEPFFSEVHVSHKEKVRIKTTVSPLIYMKADLIKSFVFLFI